MHDLGGSYASSSFLSATGARVLTNHDNLNLYLFLFPLAADVLCVIGEIQSNENLMFDCPALERVRDRTTLGIRDQGGN